MEPFPVDTNSTDLHSLPLLKPQDILSAVILSLTFLLGVPGNGLVLWVAGLKMKWTVNTVWYLHLTLADFICCLSLPFSLAHVFLQGHWPYGLFLCKLIPSIIVLNMFASVFLLTAISLDRCLMVHKPIWCQNHRNVRTAFAICGCVWMMAFVMCVPVFVYRDVIVMGDHSTCSYNVDSYKPFDYGNYMYNLNLTESNSTDNPTAQLTEQTDKSDPSATTALQAQTFQRSPEDSFPLDSARLSSHQPHYSGKPPSVLRPAAPSGFPVEDCETDTGNAKVFLSAHIELSPTTSSSYFYHPELSYDFQYDYLDQFIYANHVPTPLVAMSLTRLVVGFLVPFFIMVACYSLIVFRMRRTNFTKSRSKTVRVALVVVMVFFVCWTPYHIVGVLLLVTNPESRLRDTAITWDQVSIALASANSCFNPFLYALLGKDFRKKARHSIKGILEAAFSEELTHSTICTQDKASSKRNDMSTSV